MKWHELLAWGGLAGTGYYLLRRQAAIQNELHHLRWQIQAQYQGMLAAQEGHYFQLEALFSLFAQIQPTAPLPPLRKWAITPDFANVLVGQIQAQKPTLVVELGGGVSTLITAYALRGVGAGRVVAVDHEETFAQAAADHLLRHGLSDIAQVIHAPLADVYVEDACWFWYSTAPLRALQGIDLLVVDGPAQHDNPYPMVRYPALPVLLDHLNPGAYILLDDANRGDERAIIEAWIHNAPVRLVREYDTLNGAVLLQKLV